jgi:hypothetical protein
VSEPDGVYDEHYAVTREGEIALLERNPESIRMGITTQGLKALAARGMGETETGQNWKVRAPAKQAERPRSARAVMLDRLELLVSRRLTRLQAAARELEHAEARAAAVDVADLVELVFAVARGRG